MKPKVGVVSDDSLLHVSWLWPWPSSALFLIHAFTLPLFFPTRSPIFCPYLSLLLESLQLFSIRLGDKTHPLPPAVLVTPVFHSCQSCGPCSCSKHAASLPGSFLLSYSVTSLRDDWSPQEGQHHGLFFHSCTVLCKQQVLISCAESLPSWPLVLPDSASRASTCFNFQLGLGFRPSCPCLSHFCLSWIHQSSPQWQIQACSSLEQLR